MKSKSISTALVRKEKLIKSPNLFPVVGIGASAGGLDAFKKCIKMITVDSGIAYVLVQHLDPKHDSLLPEILQKVSKIPVLQISDDVKVLPNHIYVIPSNKMIVANDGILNLAPRPEKGNLKRNHLIDIFFTSLSEVHQSHSIGVVLSGNGTDGTLGLKAIKDQGGLTFVQSIETAAYTGMPNSAIQSGVINFVLAPEKIASKLLELTRITNIEEEQISPHSDDDIFKQIISVLRIRKGTDFTYYKQTTIHRRILRRMAINRFQEPSMYLQFLRINKQEQDVLYQDLLIPVTSFFRDTESFELVCSKIAPAILKSKQSGDVIRIWSVGCSTGEEAYSLAICFQEILDSKEAKDLELKIQIFASDLSEPAISKARSGIYSKIETQGVSTKRLQQFFTKTSGAYQVNRKIRDMCVFACHNFLKDPPFGKLDLVICRNVLIYMEPYLQNKALNTFHYSLLSNGFLWLGKSETTNGVPNLFTTVVKNEKIFHRKDVASKFLHTASKRTELNLNQPDSNSKLESIYTDFQKATDELLLSQYTPPSVVVNDAMDIVQFRGNTSDFLVQGSGKPSHNIFSMAKNGLAFELRNLIHKVKKAKSSLKKENIQVDIKGKVQNISIEVNPLLKVLEPHYLILFKYGSIIDLNELVEVDGLNASKKHINPKDIRIIQLEQELTQTREDMHIIAEDQSAANEELQSANEELLSGSEELQSLNEELETSKEELLSTNEELTIINQEISGLNEQISISRNYSESIVANIREPLLILHKNLHVKSANEAFYKMFNVSEKNTENILIYELGDNQWDIPKLRDLLEKIIPNKSIISNFEVTHNFPIIGKRVMLLNAREVQSITVAERLIILSIEDITERKKADNLIKKSEEHFRQLAELMPNKIWTSDKNGKSDYFNKIWYDYSGLTFKDLKGFGLYKIIHPDDRELTRKSWEKSIRNGSVYEVENRLLRKDGQYLWHLSRAIPLRNEDGIIKSWIGSKTEIQYQKNQEEQLEIAISNSSKEVKLANDGLKNKNEELERMNKELESFAFVSSHDLQEPLRKIRVFSDMILEKELSNLSEDGKSYFQMMNNSAERMQALIHDLLTFSRVNVGERKFEKIRFDKIVNEVKADFKETLLEQNAVFTIKGSSKISTITFQFRQIISNLISNSLKFSKKSEPIIMTAICSSAQIGAKLSDKLNPTLKYNHISFADNGIGFDNALNEKIFEVFQRLHSKDDYPGTGMGLSIVKKIIDNHHGIITATGESNSGATFDIYLPNIQ